MVAAIVQIVIGFSGLMGFIIKFIGPLTIVPTIALVGLPLFETAYYYASKYLGPEFCNSCYFTVVSIKFISSTHAYCTGPYTLFDH